MLDIVQKASLASACAADAAFNEIFCQCDCATLKRMVAEILEVCERRNLLTDEQIDCMLAKVNCNVCVEDDLHDAPCDGKKKVCDYYIDFAPEWYCTYTITFSQNFPLSIKDYTKLGVTTVLGNNCDSGVIIQNGNALDDFMTGLGWSVQVSGMTYTIRENGSNGGWGNFNYCDTVNNAVRCKHSYSFRNKC